MLLLTFACLNLSHHSSPYLMGSQAPVSLYLFVCFQCNFAVTLCFGSHQSRFPVSAPAVVGAGGCETVTGTSGSRGAGCGSVLAHESAEITSSSGG